MARGTPAFTAADRRAWNRVGDTLLPGYRPASLPSFSASGAVELLPRLLAASAPEDVAALRIVVRILACLPRPLIAAVLHFLRLASRFGGPLFGGPCRLLELGLRGPLLGCYYAGLDRDAQGGSAIHAAIGYQISCESDLEPDIESDMDKPPMNSPIDAATLLSNARRVADTLREVPLAVRVQEIRALLERLRDQREEVISRIVAETGKSRTDALVSEVMGTLDYLHWLAGAAPAALREQRVSTPLALLGKKSRIWHEPLGVVLVITPWNYPLHIALTSIVTAFVAGNAVLLKPSEHTPLAGLFEELAADLPWLSQALTVVQGDGSSAQALIAARPDKICFTGSTRTGRRILAQAAPLLIPVELELGGKDAMLVFDDVDLGRTTAGALWGALTNGGQSCTAVERLYVQQGIYDQMVDRLRAGIDALMVNSGDDGDADIGAMTTDFQCDIVERHLEDARAKGGSVYGGGRVVGTRMLRPALVTGVTDDMVLMQEETFGPVLPVLAFADEAEAIERTNNSRFGLSASVWSADLTRARRVAAALNVGAVSINNVMLTEGNPALPFGGVGESGYGRTKGVQGLLGMTRSKAVLIDKQSRKIEANWFPYTRRKYQLFGELIRGLFGRGLGALLRFARAGITLESAAQKPRQREDQ